MTDPKRPDCWGFAMSFVGDPEAQDIERYVSALEAEIERLRADAARLDWLSTGGNWIRPEEIYEPAPGYSLRQFIDDCMTPPKDTP